MRLMTRRLTGALYVTVALALANGNGGANETKSTDDVNTDYNILDVVARDILDPSNPCMKTFIENAGVPKYIVFDNQWPNLMFSEDSWSCPEEVSGLLPKGMAERFEARNRVPPKPLDQARFDQRIIKFEDIEEMNREVAEVPLELSTAFWRKYPDSAGFLLPNHPVYSDNGRKAVLMLPVGPTGGHPQLWVYVLSLDGVKWSVELRRLFLWD